MSAYLVEGHVSVTWDDDAHYFDLESLKEVLEEKSVSRVKYDPRPPYVYMQVTCTDESNQWFYTDLAAWKRLNKVDWIKEGF